MRMAGVSGSAASSLASGSVMRSPCAAQFAGAKRRSQPVISRQWVAARHRPARCASSPIFAASPGPLGSLLQPHAAKAPALPTAFNFAVRIEQSAASKSA
jgi:hypothetical protein